MKMTEVRYIGLAFFGKEAVKMILDWMAFYKINRFHWHLTEAPVQYYTTADIQETVQYASERFITGI